MSLAPTKAFEDFLARAKEANTHPAKLLILSDMLRSVFGVKLEDLIPGIETKLGSRILGVRGSVDLIFSNIIFELKVDLKKEETDARSQIHKYFLALEERYPDMRYIAIATDCSVFKAYVPAKKGGVITGVNEISSIDAASSSAADSILWLDSFIFSRQKIRPSAEDLKWRFGAASPAYWIAVNTLSDLWGRVRNEPDAKLKFELWSRNLEIVYGKAPEEQSFLEHTYLVTLVKLIVYLRLSADSSADITRLERALSGEYFISYGIKNLIEEDFFLWLLHPSIKKESLELSMGLVKELLRYDFSQIDEDFFKEIYQDIIEKGQRHRIGEYYTPEWLTELTLKEAIEMWQKDNEGIPSILDAFSGSGTFLSCAVRLIKEMLYKKNTPKEKILSVILSSVVGMDINPLAVTIARANYLISLGELLTSGKGITIPNFVSDSVKIPKVSTIWEFQANKSVEVYDIEVAGTHLQIPTRVGKDRSLLGEVLNSFREGIEVYRKDKDKNTAVKVLERVSPLLTRAELGIFESTFQAILSLLERKEDSIWLYVINNMYAPVALMESKFDILASNPPWISMRYIENKEYQDFLKEQVLNYGLLNSQDVKLFTHMEMATLCYCRSSDLYLNDKGVIAFVMPRSVLTAALQHRNFQMMKKPSLKMEKILDLEDVIPLFNVPSCVIIARKNQETKYPVFARRYRGELVRKNARLEEAKDLVVEDYNYEPPKALKEQSPYHDRVRQGATIVPRSFWFVDFQVQKVLGIIDTNTPRVRTAAEILEGAKEPWKGIALEGNVEKQFIYCTLLGGDIVPFGFVRLWPVVLPIEPQASSYTLLSVEALRNRGALHIQKWLQNAQKFWEERRTERSAEGFDRVEAWLNYRNKLTDQNPQSKYLVLYNTSGTNLVSCVISRQSLPEFRVDGTKILPNGFIAESTTYYLETDSKEEAHYLCAFLNAPVVNEMIKPLQPRGLWGARHIHRRPFMLPIPEFDFENKDHLRLSELSMQCHVKVSKLLFGRTSSGRARAEARKSVSEELKQVNDLVSAILGV